MQNKYAVSPELTAISGETELSRGEALKKIWDYIKLNNLQNPDNKRQIVPDEKLGKLFGSMESVDMMKIAGLLTPHILK